MIKIELDIVINGEDNDVDMQYGLETLKGTSDVVSIVAETILKEKIPDKRTHKSNVRTKLKSTFTGSYGQRFSLEIKDNILQKKFSEIGSNTFLEVLCYFVLEALYIESPELSSKAEALVAQLEGVAENLMNRLQEPLIEMHKISKYFNREVKIRKRIRGDQPKQILLLDSTTAKNITDAVRSDQEEEIEIVVVRFHSITGNGRFYIKGQNKIESFGFASEVKEVKDQIRKAVSHNLHLNNTVNPDKGTFIKVKVKKISLPKGKVIKYLISGVFI